MDKIKFRSAFYNDANKFLFFSYWGKIDHKGNFSNGCFAGFTSSGAGSIKYNDMFIGEYDNTTWDELTKEEQEKWISQGQTPMDWNGYELYENDKVMDIQSKHNGVIEFIQGAFTISPEYEPRDLFELIRRKRIKKIGTIHES